MGRIRYTSNKKTLRSGYTTGACAAAAAKAAIYQLIYQKQIEDIEILLPIGDKVQFPLFFTSLSPNEALASVIKDAGDDPDCTHGLEIQCIARWQEKPHISVTGGKGVAKVTLPGLELAVGESAINPVPRKNILHMAYSVWDRACDELKVQAGIELEIIVPLGEEVAKSTINERLGLVGGISILGTRGTVIPYSTSAYSASVRQAIQIAQTNKHNEVILTTGSRSEKAAQQLFPHCESMMLIQAGDFVGVGLRAAKRYNIQKVNLVVMIGKMAKMVSGHFMTHVSGRSIDFTYLAQLAEEFTLDTNLSKKIENANTGRHVLNLLKEYDRLDFLHLLCQKVQQNAHTYVKDALQIDVFLIDFDGTLLCQT